MAGDAVLVALAEKMQQMCQETDIVMRLGGDEFAMYLRGVHTRAEAEGHKIYVYPMDYEEFLWATGGNPNVIDMAYKANMEMGNTANRNAMRDFRIYMAVGGMPQAVESYIETNSFESVDKVKREILDLYYDDLKKIDTSGRITDMYKSVPSQLAGKKKHYVIAAATGKQKTRKDEERLFELIDSGLVLPCYNVTNPGVSLSQTKEIDSFKENKEGVAIMCRAIEEMRNQEREEGRAEGRTTELIALVKDGLLAAAEAAKRLQLSEKEFMDLMEDGH